jgi:hypothetical protein
MCLRSIEIIYLVWTNIPTSRVSRPIASARCCSSPVQFPRCRRVTHFSPDQPRKRTSQIWRPPKVLHFPGHAGFRMVPTSGRSTGVVQLQDQVVPRQGMCRQCSNLSGRSSNRSPLIGSMMAMPRAGCKRDCRARLHESAHPGISDNNNTFTWSGPSGVLGCTGQRRGAPLSVVVHIVRVRFVSQRVTCFQTANLDDH